MQQRHFFINMEGRIKKDNNFCLGVQEEFCDHRGCCFWLFGLFWLLLVFLRNFLQKISKKEKKFKSLEKRKKKKKKNSCF